MATIAELTGLYKQASSDPRGYFGDDIDGTLKSLQSQSHPDRFTADADKAAAEKLFKDFALLADDLRKPPVTIALNKKVYTLGHLIASGDTSDVYDASLGPERFTIKISRIQGTDVLVKHEATVLQDLQKDPVNAPYMTYLPTVVESVRCKGSFPQHVTVFASATSRFFTLAQVHEKYPDGVDPVHLAWIYNRLLEVLGFLGVKGLVHGNVLPENILVFPETHGISLLDWKVASKPGVITTISAKYRDWYPPEVLAKKPVDFSSDIYLATKCLQYLAGKTDSRIARFLKSAVLERQSMRPGNAWALKDEFKELLADMFGKPKFHTFVMN